MMSTKKLAYLEFERGHEGLKMANVVTKEDLPTPSEPFKIWLRWAEPGEAYLERGGRFLYLCVQLTTGE